MKSANMKSANIVLAVAAALALTGSTVLAEQNLTGMVTKIDRTRSTIAIQPEQGGTVGSSAGLASEEFKAQDRSALDVVHAGDKVSYSIKETNGIKTIVKLEKQRSAAN